MPKLIVFIVKIKWRANSATSQVKRVFFKEENAMAYINKTKTIPKYKGANWIVSDRPISDSEDFTILSVEQNING